MAQDAPLQRGARVAQLLPVGQLRDGLSAPLADRPGRDAHGPAQLRVAPRHTGRCGKPLLHADARMSARCAVRTPERRRDRAPPIWSRHELSIAVHTAASVSSTLRTLSASIASDVSAFLI